MVSLLTGFLLGVGFVCGAAASSWTLDFIVEWANDDRYPEGSELKE